MIPPRISCCPHRNMACRAVRLHSIVRLRPLPPSFRLLRFSSSDPFPLPLSDPNFAAIASRSPRAPQAKEDWPLPEPLDRSGETEQTLRARLVYQTRKRGTLETDLLLSTFARDELSSMPLEDLREFDKVFCFLFGGTVVGCCMEGLIGLNSCWMNRIGISIIGLSKSESHLRDGRIRPC